MVEDENGIPVTKNVGPGCTIYVPESRFHSTKNTDTARCNSSSSIRRPVQSVRFGICLISD